MMLGAGFLMMALVFGLPLVLILIAIIGATGGGWQRWLGSTLAQLGPSSSTPATGRYCAHCGQALQASWSHCPHCGASSAAAGQ